MLKHFCHYRHGFSVDQLQHHILPELLVGIKDNDDILVASTLRALADLVPVLGAATVIGGKRGKLFTDGRPKVRRQQIFYSIWFSTNLIFFSCGQPENPCLLQWLHPPFQNLRQKLVSFSFHRTLIFLIFILLLFSYRRKL